MLYDGSNPILRFTDAVQLRRDFGNFTVGAREYAELSFLLSGSITIACAGNEYTVKPGDILYLPQMLTFSAGYAEAEMITLHFVTESADICPEVYSLHGTRSFHTLFLSTLLCWETKKPGYQVNCISLLYRLFCTIFNRYQVPPSLKKAIAFIHANYQNSGLTVGQVCEHAGVSPTVLRQLFNTHYKRSPLEYIIILRLLNARVLISNGVPIETAALECGFNDPKYFARLTKKHFNRTPSELKDFE